jgi:hypothetical protein
MMERGEVNSNDSDSDESGSYNTDEYEQNYAELYA